MSNNSYKFNVEFLTEAFQFLEKLDGKTREKVLENIRIARFKTDPRLLKRSTRKSGSLEPPISLIKFDY